MEDKAFEIASKEAPADGGYGVDVCEEVLHEERDLGKHPEGEMLTLGYSNSNDSQPSKPYPI